MARTYYRVQYQSNNGFDCPYFDIKWNPYTTNPPIPLQYEVDLSLGDGSNSVYTPLMARSTDLPNPMKDAIYTIDWGDGTIENRFFDDGPSANPGLHNYAISGTYIISITVPYGIPWRNFQNFGFTYLGQDEIFTRIVQWGNQLGKVAKPFKINFGSQNNFISIPDNLDTTNIASDGLKTAFSGCDSFTGNTVNFTNLGQDLNQLFQGTSFNQDISNWDTSTVTNMLGMFGGTSFNQDISSWDVSNVTNFSGMFGSNSVFNQDLGGSWDTSSAIYMSEMFRDTIFNQDIGDWNVSNVEFFNLMFLSNSVFNQDLSSWDTGKGRHYGQMFKNCTSFNQSLSDWDISSTASRFESGPIGESMSNMLDDCGMSQSNYDLTLIGWESQLNVPTDVRLGALNLTYTLGGSAEAARTSLINVYGWEIVGDSGV